MQAKASVAWIDWESLLLNSEYPEVHWVRRDNVMLKLFCLMKPQNGKDPASNHRPSNLQTNAPTTTTLSHLPPGTWQHFAFIPFRIRVTCQWFRGIQTAPRAICQQGCHGSPSKIIFRCRQCIFFANCQVFEWLGMCLIFKFYIISR